MDRADVDLETEDHSSFIEGSAPKKGFSLYKRSNNEKSATAPISRKIRSNSLLSRLSPKKARKNSIGSGDLFVEGQTIDGEKCFLVLCERQKLHQILAVGPRGLRLLEQFSRTEQERYSWDQISEVVESQDDTLVLKLAESWGEGTLTIFTKSSANIHKVIVKVQNKGACDLEADINYDQMLAISPAIEGEDIPFKVELLNLHKHTLIYRADFGSDHFCNCCKTKKIVCAYHCAKCDWNLCLNCAATRVDLSQGESKRSSKKLQPTSTTIPHQKSLVDLEDD